MKFWIDAQLSPHLAPWLAEQWGVEAFSARRLGLRDAKDHEIFRRAREKNAIVVTKDADFVSLLEREGAPPRVLWVTVGNTSNQNLKSIFEKTFDSAMRLFEQGEDLVEIAEA